MAKKFFYVCAGLLLLTGAYTMAAKSAGAQDTADVGDVCQLPEKYGIVVNRVPYTAENTGTTIVPAGSLAPIPGTSDVIAFGACSGDAILANGDVYGWAGTTVGWRYKGNIVGLPTPPLGETFGGVKSKYR